MNTYLRDISRYKPLTPQEELTLATRARQGDTEARNQLIEANLRLVVNIARQYQRPGVELLNLIQEGNIGLIKTVDKYDPSMGNRLSTVAFYWINKQIQRFLNNEQEDTISLDMEINDGATTLLLSDTIEDKDTALGHQTCANIQDRMEKQELQEQVSRMLDTLSQRDKQVMELLYGLNGYPEMSRKQIAKVMGLSQQYISRIRINALRDWKKMFEKKCKKCKK